MMNFEISEGGQMSFTARPKRELELRAPRDSEKDAAWIAVIRTGIYGDAWEGAKNAGDRIDR